MKNIIKVAIIAIIAVVWYFLDGGYSFVSALIIFGVLLVSIFVNPFDKKQALYKEQYSEKIKDLKERSKELEDEFIKEINTKNKKGN